MLLSLHACIRFFSRENIKCAGGIHKLQNEHYLQNLDIGHGYQHCQTQTCNLHPEKETYASHINLDRNKRKHRKCYNLCIPCQNLLKDSIMLVCCHLLYWTCDLEHRGREAVKLPRITPRTYIKQIQLFQYAWNSITT